ncbi:adenylosuccinate lyase [Candidatus Falkowbacteria bacterium CG10_big_fil_rev_8_21_14_0_10_39_11]|uniref:Adenylosuccinate lyase n=1 Tax=Candidatus Falkowbacteria bacterium CG10_big_fil_rev_8_21_14_0_10_39_11 TaxID=1974565 RepID=A0A2H0V5F5_9BACT|nr:MAG: adenylosuccinate lyase [Candidatus Falkowbacteria bacterium CG10_big_fil_rev_8_21_14_0_10_39_11]
MTQEFHPLDAINPIDGRYRDTVSALEPYLSERALFWYRLKVEVIYFLKLVKWGIVPADKLSDDNSTMIRHLLGGINLRVYTDRMKQIETTGYEDPENGFKVPATNHDVKAVEYFLQWYFTKHGMKHLTQWIHFGLTSEDVNNLAYSLMLRDALENVILPNFEPVIEQIDDFARKFAALPTLARTHGQPASPTTLGKEFKVFGARLHKQICKLKQIKLESKLNGATGNYNAMLVAFPHIDWPKFAAEFIAGFSRDHTIHLVQNEWTTQIESHDSMIELFDCLRRINMILIDLCQDVWRYVSDGWLKQSVVDGEVGSSTMPHKVNPIDFESAEGNLGLANALFEFFSRKLPVSRLQRDLSDSTVQRNIGVALAYSLIAYKVIFAGLVKISADEKKITADLNSHPEVLAEAIQTILRLEGIAMPYERLKALTRGQKITIETLWDFVQSLQLSPELESRLLALRPHNYIGLAAKLAKKTLR